MKLREQLDVLEKVAEIATLAGIKGGVNEEKLRYEAGFDLEDGRSQVVHVRVSGQSMTQAIVVTFLSACLAVKTGFLKGLSKDQALELLKRNEKLMFARYGIWDVDGHDVIVASVDHLLDTLDPQEFHSHMWHVAMAADAYEREHGQDQF